MLYVLQRKHATSCVFTVRAVGYGMAPAAIPDEIDSLYEVREWRNAIAVLSGAHPQEWAEILKVLGAFRLLRSDVLAKGGRKSLIASKLDSHFFKLGWEEKSFDTKITVDDTVYETPTHSVDCFKNRVALEVEWNNKDPFFDRDLNNFRLLFDLRAIDVGVIITRCSELQDIFKGLGKNIQNKYGQSTTHMNKLVPRIEGGGGGGCPIVVFGIGREAYVEDG